MTGIGVRNQKGIVAPLTAFMLVVLMGLIAFAIDLGYICSARATMQRSADSCALTAAWYLPNQTLARTKAKDMSDTNYGLLGAKLQDEDVEFGYWNSDNATFVSPTPSGRSTNAVRVTVHRKAERGNPLNLFFAHLLNKKATDISTYAIALMDRELCGPFVGIESVSVSGDASTDSYDSNEGAYGSYAPGDRGSICSDGPILVTGGTTVNGDAMAGKAHSVHVDNNATVTGMKRSRRRPLNLPPVDASSYASNNDNDQLPMVKKGNNWVSLVDNNGNFLLDGTKTITIEPGTYYFNNFTVKGQSTVNIKGPVKIYIVGNLERSGGTQVISLSEKPADFKIFMTGGTAKVTSQNDFYGVIYAPNTHVTVDGGSNYFGAIVGKTLVKTGSASGHYDESLDTNLGMLPKRVYLVN